VNILLKLAFFKGFDSLKGQIAILDSLEARLQSLII
jgi:hypothetical protein